MTVLHSASACPARTRRLHHVTDLPFFWRLPARRTNCVLLRAAATFHYSRRRIPSRARVGWLCFGLDAYNHGRRARSLPAREEERVMLRSFCLSISCSRMFADVLPALTRQAALFCGRTLCSQDWTFPCSNRLVDAELPSFGWRLPSPLFLLHLPGGVFWTFSAADCVCRCAPRYAGACRYAELAVCGTMQHLPLPTAPNLSFLCTCCARCLGSCCQWGLTLLPTLAAARRAAVILCPSLYCVRSSLA